MVCCCSELYVSDVAYDFLTYTEVRNLFSTQLPTFKLARKCSGILNSSADISGWDASNLLQVEEFSKFLRSFFCPNKKFHNFNCCSTKHRYSVSKAVKALSYLNEHLLISKFRFRWRITSFLKRHIYFYINRCMFFGLYPLVTSLDFLLTN